MQFSQAIALAAASATGVFATPQAVQPIAVPVYSMSCPGGANGTACPPSPTAPPTPFVAANNMSDPYVPTTFVVAFPAFCTCEDHTTLSTYTVTEMCPSASVGQPIPSSYVPSAFAVTTSTCNDCAATPITAVITAPTSAGAQSVVPPAPTAAAAAPASPAAAPASPAAAAPVAEGKSAPAGTSTPATFTGAANQQVLSGLTTLLAVFGVAFFAL